jgi:hypothetical protein
VPRLRRRIRRAPILLEVCCRIRTPHSKVVRCAIVSDAAPGVEVRAFFADDDLLQSQRAPEIGAARHIAAAWRQTLIDNEFVELPPSPEAIQ